MKIILTMAVSANGMIATESGSEDFLSHENWKQFVTLAKRVGSFMWGRKTYEAVLSWEGDYLSMIDDIVKIVISKNADLELKHGFVRVDSPKAALKYLQENGHKESIITGGATINSAFAKEGLIDEVYLFVNPSIVGKGIPVFTPSDFELKLDLVDVKNVDDSIVRLHYNVTKTLHSHS